jgi:glycine/D-amino acid oxidase-like deaminating enzyme
MILMLWGYHLPPVAPEFPIAFDPLLPDVVLRGLMRMIPGMKAYLHRLPRPRIDGGYYTRTRENMPLIGPLPVKGAYVIGALSGFGMMASSAAGELLAAHITGSPLPDFAPAFLLERYQDAEYLQEIEQLAQDGQI